LNATATVQDLVRDLETVPAFLALDADVVWVEALPRADWLKSLRDAGIVLPEFRKRGNGRETFPERHVAGVEPWGWSPDAFEWFRPAEPKLIPIEGGNGEWARAVLAKGSFAETGLGPLFSKIWSVRFYRAWMEAHPEDAAIFAPGLPFGETLGETFVDWPSARRSLEARLSRSEDVLAKAPFGTAGRMNRRLSDVRELESSVGAWIRKTIETQGAIVLEPWMEKVADLSLQLEVGKKSRVLEGRQFLTGSRLEYRGTMLGPGWKHLGAEENRFLHSSEKGPSPLSRWQAMAEAIGAALYAAGYMGNAGVDALLGTKGERLFFRPIVEVNPRWTMGRVALELERYVLPATPAAWLFVPALAGTTLVETARRLAARHPIRKQTKSGKEWISQGVVLTNDPATAREVLTVLAVGAEAVRDVRNVQGF
jgi:hypothetical protein